VTPGHSPAAVSLFNHDCTQGNDSDSVSELLCSEPVCNHDAGGMSQFRVKTSLNEPSGLRAGSFNEVK
jgi:hypothetical protein